jgi:hypothetical protein
MTKEEFFKRNKNLVNRFVRQRLAKTKRVVHGSRAQNVQMPRFLNRPTRDWDIFAKNPKKAAVEMEKLLDKKFKGDFFRIKKGITKKLKVNKVVSTVTGKGFVDFSIPDRVVPTKFIRKIKFATLRDQKDKALDNISNPSKLFRREKDKDFIKRLRKFEKLRGKKI